MNVSVTEFKARCTRLLRDLPQRGEPVHITRRGKVVAIVAPATPPESGLPAWGALRGSVRHVARDFDQPLGESEWEAGR